MTMTEPRFPVRITRGMPACGLDKSRRSARRCDIFPTPGRSWREDSGPAVVLAGAVAGYGGDRKRPGTGVLPCAAGSAWRWCTVRRHLPLRLRGQSRVIRGGRGAGNRGGR